ncbi:hypothetical protein K0O13_07875 [Mammaliicoccus sciuri]|uniref:hypothetical protein n=1 Tax=Mammaliicoccus sciuri TaxID=1296 RepID=UPI001C631018|nr:hypothetical protein [Mammaliicoccus sciuri]QYG30017.1 hypothetical protein K0O13_07875 [Mammaliicoccus sciuri]
MLIMTIEGIEFIHDHNFQTVTPKLIYREEIKNETDGQRKIQNYLNRYLEYEQVHESEKKNHVKFEYWLRDYGGLYYNIGFNYETYEI